jgi:PAS domain S-box-containing protein
MQNLRVGAPTAPTKMGETRFEEMKRYVRLDEGDAAALRAFRPIAEPHFVRIAREFYERIREHEEAHAVFTGEAQIERLQRSLVSWMGRVLSGSYDEAYANEARKIGEVHVRVGLPERYMFTAMALIRVALEEVAEAQLGANAAKARAALTRILDLELALMVESYREHLSARARRRTDLAAASLRTDLASALRLYKTAIEVTPSLVVGLDTTGVIRLFNPAAQTITGHAEEEVVGSTFSEVLSPDETRSRDAELLDRLVRGAPTQHQEEMSIRTRSGRLRDVRWELSRVAETAQDDIVLYAIGADVTDSRATSMRIRQNEKLAALGTLAAGLAHEIRNPLNGAQLHVSFLKRALEKTHADTEMVEAAAVVADEIRRLAGLVSEFLDFARPSALVRRRVVVQALILRVVELTGEAARSAGITIAIDSPPQELVVIADGAKLEQVLLNMVQNAVEALAPSNTGNIVVRARRQPRNVVIEIEDDGPGLPSPDAPIFDAFFSTKPAGTGLGLAITHRIVTDHGGTVDVESRPGRTCFRVTIPIGNELQVVDTEGESR